MIIYPAIDLHNGHCVRLYQGKFTQVQVYGANPLALALAYAARGAEFLHVIDLDGAREGEFRHLKVIARIKQETGLLVQTGGGVRNSKQVVNLLANGIARVVIGSLAATDPEKVIGWLKEFDPKRIALAFDVRYRDDVPYVTTDGWQKETNLSLWDLLAQYENTPLKHVLCTDTGVNGSLEGPNIKLYRELCERYPQLNVQASGGVANLQHLRDLSGLGVAGAVVGKALMERCFTLERAIAEASIY
ncbi:MAG: 1-(5-phosphoribosyl)-5-[(5-phosphoribosylamino)methylideneamino]imidazole-4-carboxamide isomerase [Gammaproteobacteria bacterium]|nr:1-(5-phosphoribosyl)-5-[(5-phosphoribosylamino)methylideneamino]imidazole-4-carboxamide isomerase [Gammaproteobacteria bacterium]